MIRKEAYVHKAVLEELKRIIEDSEIMKEDDTMWPNPDRVGRQVRLDLEMCLVWSFKWLASIFYQWMTRAASLSFLGPS